MLMLNKKGVTEATIFYIIAIALGVVVVLIYIIFAGPSNILHAISNFFSGFGSAVTGGLNGSK